MKRTLVSYRTRSDLADENARLIKAAFDELAETKPGDFRYAAVRLEDDTFIHIVELPEGDNPLQQNEAWKTFQAGLRDRCVEPPVVRRMEIVGNYRMLV